MALGYAENPDSSRKADLWERKIATSGRVCRVNYRKFHVLVHISLL